MDYNENRRGEYDQANEIYSKRIKAGKRTYMFDVRATRGNDYYITITERKRDHDGDGYYKQKLFLYKEDFNKFLRSLEEVILHVKEELMPDFDYDQFDRERQAEQEPGALYHEQDTNQ
ncbi:MAG: PUR family DNA/RNA-binding protein [Bacteroidetes bacterium]|nr:PUR family DNA/RNA-binding protein [Bacteroidota bacterium]